MLLLKEIIPLNIPASKRIGLLTLILLFSAMLTGTAQVLNKAEYFWDSDPGTGNATNIVFTPGSTVDLSFSAPTTSLSSGFHTLNMRFRSSNGNWSHFTSRTLFIYNAPNSLIPSQLKRAEYFFDADPGVGQATALPLTAGNPQTNSFVIETTGLTPGFHTLVIRYQDNQNQWGHYAARTFFLLQGDPFKADNLVRAEYFIDTNPDADPNLEGTELAITPSPSFDQLFEIDAAGLTEGSHILYVRVKDDNGFWSTPVKETFTILTCIPPAPPVVPNQSRCGEGTVTFNATGASGTQVYRWYADATSMDILFTGPAFTTPSLASVTTYHVSIFDPVTLCESNRTEVTATITVLTKPVINPSGVLTLCEGNTALLTAPEGFSVYAWSNGESTRQILVTASGSFSVQTGNGTCLSEASDAVTVNFTPRPDKPSVTPSGTTSLCDGSTVTLTAPDGFTYAWSSGQTTREILVSTAGNYSVVVTNANGCASVPSDAISVTANTTPTKPVIETFGNTTLCGTNTIGLLAPIGFSIYQWSGGQTVAGITVASAGTYTVVIGNATNCLSVASDPIVVTATGQPCTGTGGTNAPPVITTQTFSVSIEGQLQADLTPHITDPDNNLNFNSLRVINNQTSRGVPASIDAAYNLVVNYQGDAFTGDDRVTIEVCDLLAACAQGFFDIEVVGGVVVFNGLSPDGDGFNDFMFIKYVDVVEGALQNKVTIFNRWGDVVFDVQNYNNLDRVFSGLSNRGQELPAGTYYYKVEFTGNLKPLTGFITLVR